MRHVPFVDITGIRNLKETLRILTESGTLVFLSGVNENIKKDLYKNEIDQITGTKNIYDSFEQALTSAENVLSQTKRTKLNPVRVP